METHNNNVSVTVTPRILVHNSEGEPDRYTAGIELSNACRSFYVSRLKAAKCLTEKLEVEGGDIDVRVKEETAKTGTVEFFNGCNRQQSQGRNGRRKMTSIDKNMTFLRQELASLVDQDLALMRQLLTLNDQIEELKWQRKFHGYSRGSLTGSSCNLDYDESLAGITDTECESASGSCFLNLKSAELFPAKYPTPSSLSIYDACYDSRTEGLDAGTPDHTGNSSVTSVGNTACLLSHTSGGATTRHRSSTSDLGSSDEQETFSPDMSVSSGYVTRNGQTDRRDAVCLVNSKSKSSLEQQAGNKDTLLEQQISTDSGILQDEYTEEIIV